MAHEPMTTFKKLEQCPAGEQRPWSEIRAGLRFNADGLIPAIVQQQDSGEVLMMAWMNAEALDETIASGQTVFWSRSRAKLWRKGESSGQVQKLIEMRVDCDGDTLLLLVNQEGPACHTGRRSCFFHGTDGETSTILSDPLIDPDELYGNG